MSNKQNNDIIDLAYYLNLVGKNWYWFALCVLISQGIAFFYLKSTPPIYKVSTSVVINEDNNNMANASAQLLNDIGFMSSSKNFSNEMLVLHSSTLIDKALQSLDLQVSYFQVGGLIDKEMYKSSPFVVIVNPDYPQPVGCNIEFKILSKDQFRMSVDAENVPIYNLNTRQEVKRMENLRFSFDGKFNYLIHSENMGFKVLLNSNYDINELTKENYIFRINTQKGLVKSFQSAIEVKPSDLESTVASISMNTSNPQKGIDFLNSLTYSYTQSELENKQHISLKTIEYINNQLANISSSLKVAEENLQQFRSRNELVDINMQSGKIFDELSKMESEKAILDINLKYYEYIDEYFNKENSVELIAPSAMGIDDPMLNNLIEELIKLNAERNSLIENNQERSPYLRKIDIRIENLKNMVAENIAYYKQTNRIKLDDLNSRINQLNQEVRKLPKTQRELLGYERQFNINDAIYSYLLEKKAEAEIAKASYQSDAKILEPADTSGIPISPKKSYILAAALFLGIFVPFGVLQFRDLIRTSYDNEEEVKKALNLPFMGHIYRNNKKLEDVVKAFPKSHMAESFRKLRSHIHYFRPEEGSKVIAVSSSISQEGKSFVSLNLALSLASIGCRTVLLGFDLRKPKLYPRLDLKPFHGISDYLSRQANIEDVLQKTNTPNLSVIWAGEEPPNPAELITSSRTKELIDYLRDEFEYIVIDTAPIGIISDGLGLLNYTDLKLFVTRVKYTPIKESKQIIEELKEQGIKDIALIVNDLPLDKKGRYGYAYYGRSK